MAIVEAGVRLAGALACAALAMLPAAGAAAASLQVAVTGNGTPAADAVVSLHSPAAASRARAGRGSVDQRDSNFLPRVIAVTLGSVVRFPNSDNVRHQVYSFSPAKRFELPLYSGRSAAPVVFDRPGVVELGCNIHDWMVGFVVVLDTPHFAVTPATGRVAIDAPPGSYTLRVWHPGLAGGTAVERRITLGAGGRREAVALALGIDAAPAVPADERLRKLQERFRNLKRGG